MYDLFWFYFVGQIRRAALAALYGLIAACAITMLSPALHDLAQLAIFGAFGLAWPAILTAPMMNFQWMATLPISRRELMITRSFIALSGLFVMGFFSALCRLVFILLMPQPKISMKAAVAAAKLFADASAEESSVSLTRLFGDDPAYLFFFAVLLLGFCFLLLSVTSVAVGGPAKNPRQSGSPWWHPEKKLRLRNWVFLIAPPLLVFALLPFTNFYFVATLNFLVMVAWSVFTLGHIVALHARIPRNGTRRLLLWLGGGNSVVALLAMLVSWLLRSKS